jgi:putative ABC transport system substrate-binding protein
MTRRQAIAALGMAVVTPRGVFAQSSRPYRIGWLSMGAPNAPSPFLDAFRQGLRARGYVEGRDVVVEARFADGSRERGDEMVTALVQSKVDVIVTQGGAVRSAASHAGATPVVFGYSGDPVAAQFAASLARPGGTRTGMTFLSLELVGKRLEVLAEVLAPGSRVAVVAHPEHPGERAEFKTSQAAAEKTGLRLGYFPVRRAEDLGEAFGRMASDGTQALVVFPDAFTIDQREPLAAFGLRQKLPAVSGWSLFAESGFLMSYGPNLRESYAHLASYVDKIIKGAKPADLPIELPTAVEFVVNARTAKTIGTKLPRDILLRADRVIE